MFILIKLNWRHFIRPPSSIPFVCVVNSYLPAGRLLFWARRPFSVTILNNSVVSFLIIGERWVEFKWLLVEDSLREFLIETYLIDFQIPFRVLPCIKMVDAAVAEKLEAGFQKLQEATNCKSLLKKHLSREIFDKIKDLKTSFGSTLLDVIQSGKSKRADV